MKSTKTIQKPNFRRKFLSDTRDEIVALFSFMLFQWRYVLLFVVGATSLLYLFGPLPPRSVTLAAGQPGFDYDQIGRHYQEFFRRNGVELNLVQSRGSIDNVAMLSDEKVDAALVQGGVPTPDTRFISLGSIQFEPVWLFYRSDDLSDYSLMQLLTSKRLSIGGEGSGTRLLMLELLDFHKVGADKRKNLVSLDLASSIRALRSGEIDGVFFVAGGESPELFEILSEPGIRIWDFPAGRAVDRRSTYIHTVEFPMGSITLEPLNPSKDIRLIATTTSLLARNDMHPAIQYLFMMASDAYYRNNHMFFDREGGFPALLDKQVPISDVANKYIRQGPSSFDRLFPFALANLLDRIWLILLTVGAAVYPLMKMAPNYRKYHTQVHLSDAFVELREIEVQIHRRMALENIELCKTRLDELEARLRDLWLPSGTKADYYDCLNALELVRIRVDRIGKEMLDPNTSLLDPATRPAAPAPESGASVHRTPALAPTSAD
jgi:uncharacterized protein